MSVNFNINTRRNAPADVAQKESESKKFLIDMKEIQEEAQTSYRESKAFLETMESYRSTFPLEVLSKLDELGALIKDFELNNLSKKHEVDMSVSLNNVTKDVSNKEMNQLFEQMIESIPSVEKTETSVLSPEDVKQIFENITEYSLEEIYKKKTEELENRQAALLKKV